MSASLKCVFLLDFLLQRHPGAVIDLSLQMLWIDSVTFESTSATTLNGTSSDHSFPKGGIVGIAVGAFFLILVIFVYPKRTASIITRPVTYIYETTTSTTVYRV